MKLVIYNGEQSKLPFWPFMKQTRGTLCRIRPKNTQHALKIWFVYQYVLECFKEVLYVSLCKRGGKLQTTKSSRVCQCFLVLYCSLKYP